MALTKPKDDVDDLIRLSNYLTNLILLCNEVIGSPPKEFTFEDRNRLRDFHTFLTLLYSKVQANLIVDVLSRLGNLTQKIEDAAKKLEDTIDNIKKRDKTLNDLAQGFSLMIGFAKAAQTQDSGKVQAFIAGQIP